MALTHKENFEVSVCSLMTLYFNTTGSIAKIGVSSVSAHANFDNNM